MPYYTFNGRKRYIKKKNTKKTLEDIKEGVISVIEDAEDKLEEITKTGILSDFKFKYKYKVSKDRVYEALDSLIEEDKVRMAYRGNFFGPYYTYYLNWDYPPQEEIDKKVLELLRVNPNLTKEELADEIDVPDAAIRDSFHTLMKRGDIPKEEKPKKPQKDQNKPQKDQNKAPEEPKEDKKLISTDKRDSEEFLTDESKKPILEPVRRGLIERDRAKERDRAELKNSIMEIISGVECYLTRSGCRDKLKESKKYPYHISRQDAESLLDELVSEGLIVKLLLDYPVYCLKSDNVPSKEEIKTRILEVLPGRILNAKPLSEELGIPWGFIMEGLRELVDEGVLERCNMGWYIIDNDISITAHYYKYNHYTNEKYESHHIYLHFAPEQVIL